MKINKWKGQSQVSVNESMDGYDEILAEKDKDGFASDMNVYLIFSIAVVESAMSILNVSSDHMKRTWS